MEERYLDVVAAVDAEFSRNRKLHGERIHCHAGCDDCCHQYFQITELEAGFISRFVMKLEPAKREALQRRARDFLDARTGVQGAWTRIACPALDQGVCALYEQRPLICHKYGMPIYNPEKPDQIFACELNFKNGDEIQDSELIQIQTGIHVAWKELQADYRAAHGNPDSAPLTVARAILEDFS